MKLCLSGSMNLWRWNSCSSSISMRAARAPASVRPHSWPLSTLSCLVSGSTAARRGASRTALMYASALGAQAPPR